MPRLPRRPRLLVPVVVALVVLFIIISSLTGLYTDLLWYRSVGFSRVFSSVLLTKILLFLIFGAAMAVIIGANVALAHRLRPPFRTMSLEQQNLDRYPVALEVLLLQRHGPKRRPQPVGQRHVGPDDDGHRGTEDQEKQNLGQQDGGEHPAETDRPVPQQVGVEAGERADDDEQHDQCHHHRHQQPGAAREAGHLRSVRHAGFSGVVGRAVSRTGRGSTVPDDLASATYPSTGWFPRCHDDPWPSACGPRGRAADRRGHARMGGPPGRTTHAVVSTSVGSSSSGPASARPRVVVATGEPTGRGVSCASEIVWHR